MVEYLKAKKVSLSSGVFCSAQERSKENNKPLIALPTDRLID